MKKTFYYFLQLFMLVIVASCSEVFEKYELPESNSIPDKTPPAAVFNAVQGDGLGEEWKRYRFSNGSVSATTYQWNFGDGNTSTEFEPTNIYPGEGTYTVTLVATDNLGASSETTEDIVVEEPPAPAAITPVIINPDFDKQAKSSGSDCACSGWINRSLGAQGESSSGNGSDVVKFDNDEHDLIYQEFEVTPNADYLVTFVAGFKALENKGFPSKLEVRVLAGAGYRDGYTPAYFATAAEYPQDDFGYNTIDAMEDANNNLLVQTINHPNDTSYSTYTYQFNAGASSSVALVMRGVGGDGTPSDNKGFAYNNGDEEIRVDSVVVEPVE